MGLPGFFHMNNMGAVLYRATEVAPTQSLDMSNSRHLHNRDLDQMRQDFAAPSPANGSFGGAKRRNCMPFALRAKGPSPFITLDGIAIRLYNRVLFEGTHWTLFDNQHWAVIGPNGSGKSTLMKALCGRVPVVQGDIAYHFAADGTKPQDGIAYVSFEAQKSVLGRQDPFYQARWNSTRSRDGTPVAEYLSLDRVYKVNPFQVVDGLPEPAVFAARRDEVVALLQIESLLERNAIQLSNGERRKVFIARALLKDPRLLILDNPFVGLDQGFRARLRTVIERLTQGDVRLIVVETDRDEIPPGITHVLSVDDCRVVDQKPVGAIPKPRSSERAQKPVFSPGTHDISSTNESPTTGRHPKAEKKQASRGQPLVHLENVTVSYNGTQVLQGVDWTIHKGEHWALIGPNGAGKTTLLSLITGDNPQAYANRVTLFGRRRGSGESIWEIKRRIGWAAPELHLYYPVSITCFDVVCSGFFDSVGLYHRCTQQQQEAAQGWMERLSIAGYADVPFRQASEGEQRMMLIARALVKDPTLLVLDEPCQGLDAANRARVVQTIDSAGEHLDASLIYVTHETDSLPQCITHVMRLQGGRLASVGTMSISGSIQRLEIGD
jgi:molybdate transport system ATP-binding protein